MELVNGSNPFFMRDMHSLCAICLKKRRKNEAISLTERIPDSTPIVDVTDVLKSIFKHNISDIGPQAICLMCFKNTWGAYIFQEQLNRTQEYLVEYLENEALMRERDIYSAQEATSQIPGPNFQEQGNKESVVQANIVPQEIAPVGKTKCKVCHEFKSTSNMHTHMKVHTGEKPYQCKICNKTFAQSSSLKRHAISHTDICDAICSHCGKTFKSAKSLKVHLRTHTGERPYACSLCDKTFTSTSILNSHMVVHNGKKDFKCDQCDKSYYRLKCLRLHQLIHKGVRHACMLCDRTFSQKHSLRTHMRTHENIDSANSD